MDWLWSATDHRHDSRTVTWEERPISFGNQSPFSSLHDSPAVMPASQTVSGTTRVVAIIRALCLPLEAFRVMNTLPWQWLMNQGEGQQPAYCELNGDS